MELLFGFVALQPTGLPTPTYHFKVKIDFVFVFVFVFFIFFSELLVFLAVPFASEKHIGQNALLH